ncbi:kinase-like domain-containing protein [Kalaharituber pfeilii]|nr:kinase-like domain-containing protein [Kalaharituber pfeilii]
MDGVENVYGYVPGGYHPVHLGDTFNNRYLVQHKLGFGGFSTVWLASDLKNCGRLCALKIMTADAADGETQFLSSVCSSPGTTMHSSHTQPQSSFFPKLLDVFTINGPNGEHECMVTEPLGPSLSRLSEFYRGLYVPLPLVRKIGLGLVQAVAELHAHGIVHGDLHPGNIVLRAPGMDAWTVGEVEKYLGVPHEVTLQEARHPDFGLAFYKCPADSSLTCSEDSRTKRMATFPPPAFSAPEVQLQDYVNITQASDVWTIGCVLFFMFAGRSPFSDYMERRNTLADLTICYGALPPEWWKRWTSRAQYFDEDGQLRCDTAGDKIIPVLGNVDQRLLGTIPRRVENDIDDSKIMGGSEFGWLRSVMLEILKLEPKDRITITEVLNRLPPRWWEE